MDRGISPILLNIPRVFISTHDSTIGDNRHLLLIERIAASEDEIFHWVKV